MRNLKLVPEEYDLPDALAMAIGQHQDATDLLHEDKSHYPRFKKLRSIDEMTGSMAPGELWMIGAQVGSGKSLFCQNLMDDLVGQELPTLYIGTEQDVEALKIKHACIRAGISPRLMFKPDEEVVKTRMYEEARDLVQEQLKWLKDQADFALFANSEYVNRRELDIWINGGVRKYDIRAVIVDHIDQVEHGPGQNSVGEATATVQFLHNMARRHRMPIIAANQVKRHPDPFKRYQPPEVDDFAGTSAKERVAAVMLGLWRPLRTDLTPEELKSMLKSAKLGAQSEDKIYQPNTMGVRLLKDRLGTAPGKQSMVHVGKGGYLSDDNASTHGIRTARGL